MSTKRLLFCYLWLATALQSFGQIQHVEPLNWWVGMKNTALQVMIHGKDVGKLKANISYTGVTLKKATSGLALIIFFWT